MKFNEFILGLVNENLPRLGSVDFGNTIFVFETFTDCSCIDFHVNGKWAAEYTYPADSVEFFCDVIGWMRRLTGCDTAELDCATCELLPDWAIEALGHYVCICILV